MKRIFTYILLLSSLLSMGCKKWLDVKPEGQTTKEELFKTQKGFRDALTGAYIRMKSGNTYGSALTWGNIEYMACNWDVTGGNQALPKLIAANYTDETVRGWLDNTYQDLYKIVADVNGILENIDAKKSVFTEGNFEMIKGESLALRAYAHFDVLRMFGPVPANPGTDRWFPYVKTLTKKFHEQISYQEFTQAILNDLNDAETLLQNVDPIRKYSIRQLNPINSEVPVVENYLNYRQVRMNYYAVLALKARVYLWLAASDPSNKVNAVKYAKMVIDGVDGAGAKTFRLGEESDRALQDYTMSSEHILALSVYNLESIANAAFGEKASLARYDFGYFYLGNLFPNSERTSDIRWKDMFSSRTEGGIDIVTFKKFIQRGTDPVLQVPLIRLSEMYLILTECAQTRTDAEVIYTQFCSKKGIPFVKFNDGDWESDRRIKIIREYAREFLAEGQAFFTYKRFNLTSLPVKWTYGNFTGNTQRYIVPKPMREINYNNN